MSEDNKALIARLRAALEDLSRRLAECERERDECSAKKEAQFRQMDEVCEGQIARAEAAEARVKDLEGALGWIDAWVSNPVGSYSVYALDGLFAETRERIAALSPAPKKGDE